MDAASWRHRRLMRLPFVANRQRASLQPTRLMAAVSAWNVILVIDQSKRKSRKDFAKEVRFIQLSLPLRRVRLCAHVPQASFRIHVF